MENSDKNSEHKSSELDVQMSTERLEQFQNILDQIRNSFTNVNIENVNGGMI